MDEDSKHSSLLGVPLSVHSDSAFIFFTHYLICIVPDTSFKLHFTLCTGQRCYDHQISGNGIFFTLPAAHSGAIKSQNKKKKQKKRPTERQTAREGQREQARERQTDRDRQTEIETEMDSHQEKDKESK